MKGPKNAKESGEGQVEKALAIEIFRRRVLHSDAITLVKTLR